MTERAILRDPTASLLDGDEAVTRAERREEGRTTAWERGLAIAAVAIFSLTIFTGASLLFLVQPMFARLVLPRLGGSSSVWNTCVLFFQTVLLLGYLYAHFSTRWLGVRRQAKLHALVLLVPLVCLPLSAGASHPASDQSPVWWLLWTMTVTVGLPFFVVSTTAPLLQRWFASLPVASARDPYFLYSASNLGSMIALLGYPLLLEPVLGVREQTAFWTAGYVSLIALTALCGGTVLRAASASYQPSVKRSRGWPRTGHPARRAGDARCNRCVPSTEWGCSRTGPALAPYKWWMPTAGRADTTLQLPCVADVRVRDAGRGAALMLPSAAHRAGWLVLSFVPSSLMLGVTTHVSSDIAAVPLLWVLPLALYLLTFVLAFARRELVPRGWPVRALPVLVFATLLTLFLNFQQWWLIPLHLTTFFCAALVCHRELAARRPDVSHLTEFYIWMSLGGMLGGVFNTLVAPQIFTTVLEYPLALALAALLAPGRLPMSSSDPRSSHSPPRRRPRQEPLIVIVAIAVIVFGCGVYLSNGSPSSAMVGKLVAAMAGLSLPVAFARRPGAFGVVALAFVAVIALGRPASGTVLFVGRSFFGVHRVLESKDGTHRTLQHGSTVHGRQELSGASDCQPTSYYHASGPSGDVFSALSDRVKHVGVVGLGSGVLACYAQAGERWTFYEIDPLVERIARNPAWFTQLRNSRGAIDVVLGDGRITLQTAAPSSYDLLVLDAFSSDAIPVHLLTREALQLYLSRLASNGIIALHVSNRYLDLEPMLGALADAEGLSALARTDVHIPPEEGDRGRLASHWIVLAREPSAIAALSERPGWRAPHVRRDVRPWTDDYSNILSVIR